VERKVRARLDERQRHPIAGEVSQGDQRLEAGDPAARDDHLERVVTGHWRSVARERPQASARNPDARRETTDAPVASVRTTEPLLGPLRKARARPAPSLPSMSSPAPSPIAEDTITIVLADDHHVVRSGLRLLLAGEEGFEVVGEAADADAALRSVLGHKPSVLVLDLNMPGQTTSLDAIPQVRERSPGTAVVVLTMQEDPSFARHALQAGAAGYVLKDSANTELVDAVRRAAAGETYVAPRLGAALAASSAGPEDPPDDLTPRELEVLRLIALGHTNAEVGEQLYLSIRTVESHRAHIQQKLRRSTRAELVRYALDHDLMRD
jgi:two-component system, NarL family, response regulator NreC